MKSKGNPDFSNMDGVATLANVSPRYVLLLSVVSVAFTAAIFNPFTDFAGGFDLGAVF